MKERLILGIDPGLQKVGWGIVTKAQEGVDKASDHSGLYQFSHVASGLIKTHNKDDLSDRIWHIFDQIKGILGQYKIEMVAIENTYVNENYQSSLKLSHARAAIIVACMEIGLKPIEYQAKTIKKTITGNGNATKDQVVYMLKHCLGGMPQRMVSLDVSDALAIAVCHGFCNDTSSIF